MRNLKLIVSGCILSLILLTASCNKQGPETLPSGENIPELQAALMDLYPDAQNVKWSQKNGYYVAEFTAPVDESTEVRSAGSSMVNYSAWFNASYQWQMTETDIPLDMLPQAVLDAFDASDYAAWRIDDVDMLRRDGVETIYVIEVEGTDSTGTAQEVDLYFSADGLLVKAVVDADPNYDYSDFIPDTASGSIEQFLAQNYPDARIVEVDIEDGMTEVEIIDGRICRDLLFDSSENWVYTRTEVRRSDVPEVVMSALQASEYGSYRIDEVDYYESPDGNFYRFDLEYGDDDVKVDVAADGSSVEPVSGDDFFGGAPAGDVASVIGQLYPGARILEQDNDDGYLKVEIWHDSREKDVYFNGAGEWVRTEWDVRISELPEAVNSTLSAEYPDYRADDAKFVQTPDGEYYLVEMEGRGDREIIVRVEADGTLL